MGESLSKTESSWLGLPVAFIAEVPGAGGTWGSPIPGRQVPREPLGRGLGGWGQSLWDPGPELQPLSGVTSGEVLGLAESPLSSSLRQEERSCSVASGIVGASRKLMELMWLL